MALDRGPGRLGAIGQHRLTDLIWVMCWAQIILGTLCTNQPVFLSGLEDGPKGAKACFGGGASQW